MAPHFLKLLNTEFLPIGLIIKCVCESGKHEREESSGKASMEVMRERETDRRRNREPGSRKASTEGKEENKINREEDKEKTGQQESEQGREGRE